MPKLNEYKFCLNIIKQNKHEFNVFDIMHMLDIYFDYISFYPSICKDLNLLSKDLGITNNTKNFEMYFSIYSEHYSSWSFNEN